MKKKYIPLLLLICFNWLIIFYTYNCYKDLKVENQALYNEIKNFQDKEEYLFSQIIEDYLLEKFVFYEEDLEKFKKLYPDSDLYTYLYDIINEMKIKDKK